MFFVTRILCSAFQTGQRNGSHAATPKNDSEKEGNEAVSWSDSGDLCNWVLDFLTGRPQVVRVGNNISSPLILNTGAPQGCVLSPLLYSLFTHDCVATHASNSIIKLDRKSVV